MNQGTVINMNQLTVSPAYAEKLYDQFQQIKSTETGLNLGMFTGPLIVASNHFPIISDCKTCDGTGEGTESTYCKPCSGSGKVKVVGVQQGYDGRPLTFTEKVHEKAFEPHWPPDVLVPLREIRNY